VYVPNGGHKVTVIRGQTNKAVSTISVGRNADSVAVNPATNTIYVGNSGPGGVAADPETNIAYVADAPTDGSPSSVSVLGPCP